MLERHVPKRDENVTLVFQNRLKYMKKMIEDIINHEPALEKLKNEVTELR